MTTRRKPVRTGNTVVAYCRVSTDEQADSGAGLAAQRATIREECKRRGWVLVNIYTDAGASGASLRGRPELAKALADVKSGEGDILMVSKLDRLSRSVPDFAVTLSAAAKQGWAVVAIDLGVDTTTPTGELVAGIMMTVAQWERRVIAVRTREALAAKKARGDRLGRRVGLPPEVRDRITAERAAGRTLAAIAAGLNSDAVPTAQGGASWHASTVRAVLSSLERDAERLAVLASLATKAAA